MSNLLLATVIVLVPFFGMVWLVQHEKLKSMTPEEREKWAEDNKLKQMNLLHGPPNLAMYCPHCQTTSQVHTKRITQDKGVSGAKATGAFLTGGVSVLATGLSRKEKNTEAWCAN